MSGFGDKSSKLALSSTPKYGTNPRRIFAFLFWICTSNDSSIPSNTSLYLEKDYPNVRSFQFISLFLDKLKY